MSLETRCGNTERAMSLRDRGSRCRNPLGLGSWTAGGGGCRSGGPFRIATGCPSASASEPRRSGRH